MTAAMRAMPSELWKSNLSSGALNRLPGIPDVDNTASSTSPLLNDLSLPVLDSSPVRLIGQVLPSLPPLPNMVQQPGVFIGF